MSLPVVLRHQAAEELLAACDYLEAQRPGLSARLMGEVRRVLERIATHPELHATVLKDVRRAAVKRFSYSVFYRQTRDAIEVLAVFHDSRDPAGWQSRT
ncbi:MAG: type II toxin-antitoxin system RelE/ParE family toxin [Pirellulales bacterium]